MAAKTIFGPPQLEVDLSELTGQQAETARSPASKTIQKQKLNSHGKETEGVCEQMHGYNPRSLHVGHNTRASVAVQI